MNEIIECIPNISEGKNLSIINSIANEINTAEGVKLLNIDSNVSANRTVITFAGQPDKVVKAAFNLIKRATAIIDMRNHKGVHPRIGAVDVCPLVPLKNITIKKTVIYARQLAKLVGEELGIPVYCYEYAAFSEKRKNLAYIRSGQYEGLKKKLALPGWKPDYGTARFNPKTGAIAIGARNIMVAYNINLNTKSLKTAGILAAYIRRSLVDVKAIGWYIREYNCAQVSTNIYDSDKSPLYIVFEKVMEKAEIYGVNVTGSEIIGLVPLKTLINSGKHYLNTGDTHASDKELINSALTNLRLNDIKIFNPQEKIIEFLMNF